MSHCAGQRRSKLARTYPYCARCAWSEVKSEILRRRFRQAHAERAFVEMVSGGLADEVAAEPGLDVVRQVISETQQLEAVDDRNGQTVVQARRRVRMCLTQMLSQVGCNLGRADEHTLRCFAVSGETQSPLGIVGRRPIVAIRVTRLTGASSAAERRRHDDLVCRRTGLQQLSRRVARSVGAPVDDAALHVDRRGRRDLPARGQSTLRQPLQGNVVIALHEPLRRGAPGRTTDETRRPSVVASDALRSSKAPQLGHRIGPRLLARLAGGREEADRLGLGGRQIERRRVADLAGHLRLEELGQSQRGTFKCADGPSRRRGRESPPCRTAAC